MASTHQAITRFPTGGMDQSAAEHATDPSSWWELLNLRPKNGRLVQVNPVTTNFDLQQFVAEAASPVRYICLMQNTANAPKYFILTENTARYAGPPGGSVQTQLFFVCQTNIPNNTTINGQMLLYGINTTDFSTNADYFEFEVVTGTTIRWRKNSGGWTTFTVALDQAIGSNGLRASFLATTGFTAGQIWGWTRTVAPPYVGTYSRWPVQAAHYNRDVYLAGLDRTILRLRQDVVTSVGYRRVYGRFVAVFYNHLVVGQFSEARYNSGAVQDSFDQATTPWVVGWSDLDNPDKFFITSDDTSEADTYTVPSNDSAVDHPDPGITGMEKWGNQLIIFLSDEMYQMNYVGLPNVMKIDPLNYGIGCFYPGSIVKTAQGLFFWSRENIYVFNGLGVRPLGDPVVEKALSEVQMLSVWADKRQQLFAFYDKDRAEISWTYWIWLGTTNYQQRQVVYQLKFNRWFFRNIPSGASGAAGDIRAICRAYDSLYQLIYGSTGTIYQDHGFGGSAANIITDVAAISPTAPTHTEPYAITPDMVYGDLSAIKDLSSFTIDATLGNASGVTLSHSVRDLLSDTVSYTAVSPTWTPSLQEKRLSLPRIAGRVCRFKFTFAGSKPYGGILNAWGDHIMQPKGER